MVAGVGDDDDSVADNDFAVTEGLGSRQRKKVTRGPVTTIKIFALRARLKKDQ